MNVETTMLKIASLYCFCHQVEMNAIVKSIEKELKMFKIYCKKNT